MHLIIEFIVNHTSNLHRWFLESQKGGKENKYANYYIWHPGKVLPDGSHAPPNNWVRFLHANLHVFIDISSFDILLFL